ncbi:hypothetical protein EVAR_93215_1 [Eumeta japonica]|uniref:Uncharacterized protein n=1 Tax=Eumeta variegata TaxID=151549 RepID=A0A4C1TXP5_EUMVA|nr:hypothetical protein EVAR_93215_1 [Eumeta japonica]
MLRLRLDVDEEDTVDVNECENTSHLSKTDKSKKRTVILGGNEPSPESDAITFEIKSASKDTLRVMCELSKALADLPTFNGNVSEWIVFRAVYNDTLGLFSDVHNVARIHKALSGEDSQDTDEHELVMSSNFLNKVANQCSASLPIKKSGS